LITQNNTSRVEGCCLANNSDMEIHHHPLLLFLLALMATCSLAACTDQSLNRTDFPASFIFGPRSSAYQVYIYIYVTALTFVCIQYIYVSLYIYIYIYIYIISGVFIPFEVRRGCTPRWKRAIIWDTFTRIHPSLSL
jgi:hypothetical protein